MHCRMVGRTDQLLSVLRCALLELCRNEVVVERALATRIRCVYTCCSQTGFRRFPNYSTPCKLSKRFWANSPLKKSDCNDIERKLQCVRIGSAYARQTWLSGLLNDSRRARGLGAESQPRSFDG